MSNSTIRVFNSSENYDVHEVHGLRALDIDIPVGHVAYFIMTHYPKHKPMFTIHREAGKICASDRIWQQCPEKVNQAVTQTFATLSPNNPIEVISTPGHYYIHSPIDDSWMGDPCHPTIVEVFVGPVRG